MKCAKICSLFALLIEYFNFVVIVVKSFVTLLNWTSVTGVFHRVLFLLKTWKHVDNLYF